MLSNAFYGCSLIKGLWRVSFWMLWTNMTSIKDTNSKKAKKTKGQVVVIVLQISQDSYWFFNPHPHCFYFLTPFISQVKWCNCPFDQSKEKDTRKYVLNCWSMDCMCMCEVVTSMAGTISHLLSHSKMYSNQPNNTI